MTDIELLPLPEWALHPKHVAVDFYPSQLQAGLKAYARANVAHATAAKDAEIERLRAVRDSFQRVGIAAQARAERLEEALDTIARVGKASRNQTTRTRWIVARAISALNGDNDWQALPKPKGFHDALLRDQEVGNG